MESLSLAGSLRSLCAVHSCKNVVRKQQQKNFVLWLRFSQYVTIIASVSERK